MPHAHAALMAPRVLRGSTVCVQPCVQRVRAFEARTALSDLDESKAQKRSLGDQVKLLIERCARVQTGVVCGGRLGRSARAWRDADATLLSPPLPPAARYGAAKREKADLEAALTSVFTELGLRTTENCTLAERIQSLVSQMHELSGNSGVELRRLTEQLRERSAQVDSLDASLGAAVAEKDTLLAKLEAYVLDQAKARKTLEQAMASIQKLTSQHTLTLAEKASLAEQVQALAKSHENALIELQRIERTLRDALASVGALSSDKATLNEQVAHLAALHADATSELRAITHALKRAMSQLGSLTSDKRRLSDQVCDLIEQLAASRSHSPQT